MGVGDVVTAGFMVFGGVAGYIDQYKSMNKKENSEGFSSSTCGILLISSIIRCYFWYGKRFETTLLFQSIVMIVAQLFLLETCIRYRKGVAEEPVIPIPLEKIPENYQQTFKNFWNWEDYKDYLKFLGELNIGLLIGIMLLDKNPILTETFGALSMGIESLLPAPQALQNYKTKSTAGFSLVLLATWFFGDLFKTYYYIANGAPAQFLLCGIIQLSVDTIILGQMLVYGSGPAKINKKE